MAFYNVRVTPDCRWKSVQVAGREFVKDTSTRLPESAVTGEIRNSPLLLVEEFAEAVAPSPQPSEPSAAAMPVLDAETTPDVIIRPHDGIQDAEATAASKVMSQRREEKSAQKPVRSGKGG